MSASVIRTGYVELVPGVSSAELGHDVVTCVDKDPCNLALLAEGPSPICKSGRDELKAGCIEAGLPGYTDDLQGVLAVPDLVFIFVGAATCRAGGSVDLTYVFAATTDIATALIPHTVVMSKSTVPVGANCKVKELIRRVAAEASADIVLNPELLHGGAATSNLLVPDRFVLGIERACTAWVIAECYAPLADKGPCTGKERFGIGRGDGIRRQCLPHHEDHVYQRGCGALRKRGRRCPRGGPRHWGHAWIEDRSPQGGPGVGVSCCAKDTFDLARTAQQNGVDMLVLYATIISNDEINRRVIDKIEDLWPEGISGKRIAELGVTFKHGTDDMRDAPALTILPALVGRGVEVRLTDPQGVRECRPLLPGASWYADALEAARGAVLVLVPTEWDSSRELNPAALDAVLRQARIADLRHLYDPAALQRPCSRLVTLSGAHLCCTRESPRHRRSQARS